jgi:hypothetical protein
MGSTVIVGIPWPWIAGANLFHGLLIGRWTPSVQTRAMKAQAASAHGTPNSSPTAYPLPPRPRRIGSCARSSTPPRMTNSSAATRAGSRAPARNRPPSDPPPPSPRSSTSPSGSPRGSERSSSWPRSPAFATANLPHCAVAISIPKCTAVTVVATVIEPKDGPLCFGPPKSTAGRRTVTIPAAVRAEIKKHVDTFVADDPDALVFTSSRGAVLRRSNFQRATNWTATVKAAGLPGFHFTTCGTPATPSPPPAAPAYAA